MKNTKDKIVILGSGNIGLSLAKGLIRAQYCKIGDITLTCRNPENVSKLTTSGYRVTNQNKDAVSNASIIIIAVLPQQLNHLLDEISGSVVPSEHLLISVVSGVSCQDIKTKLGNNKARVIRTMPNTAIAIGQSMTCIAADDAANEDINKVTDIFETVGAVIKINEDLMTAATALCACGIAFFLRSVRAASQGGVEIGFHAEDALKMAVQTAKGAAELLLQHHSHPEHEIDRVTSPKGCTIAGLNEMEHHGFSSSLIKGIKHAAEKAGALYAKG